MCLKNKCSFKVPKLRPGKQDRMIFYPIFDGVLFIIKFIKQIMSNTQTVKIKKQFKLISESGL